jgi:hypothetical protein
MKMMIPKRDGVDVEGLHPILKRRLAAFFADPRNKGMYVYSGVRTYAHQKRLYDEYKAGIRKDLAANPDRVLGERTYFGVTGLMFGSKHMPQPRFGGWSYAADLAGYDAGTEAIAREYGLIRTIPSEMWHYEPDPRVVTRYDEITEVEMAEGVYVRNGGATAYTDGIGIVVFATPTEASDHRKKFAADAPPSEEISLALWDALTRGR